MHPTCCILVAKIFNDKIVMVTTKLYLDNRYAKKGNPGSLKLCIVKKGKAALIPLGISIFPNQWDKCAQKICNHPNKLALNNYIFNRCVVANNLIFRLVETGEMKDLSITDLKNRIESEFNPEPDADGNNVLFEEVFVQFANLKKKSTKDCYMHTYGRMKAFCSRLSELRFEDITREWLMQFDFWLSENGSPSKNARNIHMRNIRAVFNSAIDDELTSCYPFRKFKIKSVETAKRSLTVEELRMLFNSDVEPHVQKYLDFFKLIFFLIGINVIDLCHLKLIRNGRIEYRRSKTNRLYSIKVEPEAKEIINRYHGNNYLLDVLDRYSNHKDYLHRLNENLQRIGNVEYVGCKGRKIYKPYFPELTTYWARHSWATIAASLDIPKETIAAALGHGGNTVTDIYIDFDRKKIDEANRKVIDWVLYGKR